MEIIDLEERPSVTQNQPRSTTPREVRERRMNQIKELYFTRRVSREQLAILLGWSEATIKRDIAAIRKRVSVELRNHNEDFLVRTVLNMEYLLSESWNDYALQENFDERRKLRLDINALIKDFNDFLTKLGVFKTWVHDLGPSNNHLTADDVARIIAEQAIGKKD